MITVIEDCVGVSGIAEMGDGDSVVLPSSFRGAIWSWLESGLPTSGLQGNPVGLLASADVHFVVRAGHPREPEGHHRKGTPRKS